jgi:ABC-type phosphate transport system substrate-binding protein
MKESKIMRKFFKPLAAAALIGLAAGSAAFAANVSSISGAGATFPYPIYSKWADDYKKKTDAKFNYQPIGSGGGIKQIELDTTQAALKFFDWAYRNGDKMAKSLDYIPMPENVTKLVEQAWHKKIHGPNGKAMWTHS